MPGRGHEIMSLKGVAKETLKILEVGGYTNSQGEIIDIGSTLKFSAENTVLYTPAAAISLLEKPTTCVHRSLHIEVTDETTQVAARRLVESEHCSDLVLLNYASARNAGGGFINGAKAQEEDLARSSGLYRCLLTQPAYYDANRKQESLLYTDHIIYSPHVPWFRTSNRELLDKVFLASVITAPAPNAGETLLRDPHAWPSIEETLRRRAGLVLAIAREHRHRVLLLGAWGCGVFRNDPAMVADAFGVWLGHASFDGCFDRVVFAIYDTSHELNTLRAFRKRFLP
jgi:uncharacterized protein (TIGR02452 family)